MKKHFLLLFLIFFISNHYSQTLESRLDEIVVSATKSEIPIKELASSITIFSRSDIERSGKQTLLELLKGVPGLSVVQQGSTGKLASVFMRGANSNHLLVVIDGVKVNDPSSANNGFDFSNLLSSDIERVEIVRGPQSTIFGSDAMAGVINIITQKGEGDPGLKITSEAGSNNYYNFSGSSNGVLNKFSYSLNFTKLHTDGISAIKSTTGAQFENDKYNNNSFSGILGYNFSNDLKFYFQYKLFDSNSGLDQSEKDGDDPNFNSKSQDQIFRGGINFFSFQKNVESNLTVSYFKKSTVALDEVDESRPNTASTSSFKGGRFKASFLNKINLLTNNTFTFGIDYEKEEASSQYLYLSEWGEYESNFPKQSADMFSLFLNDHIKFSDKAFLSAGLRYDTHERFGSEVTYKLSPVYFIEHTRTKLKANYGTGFKSPSLYYLYDPLYGNDNLKPEKSYGWDVGFEQFLLDSHLMIGVSYFDLYFNDMIGFDENFRSINLGKVASRGIEITFATGSIFGFELSGSYTFNKVFNEADSDKMQLIRRPEHKAELNINNSSIDKLNLNLSLNYNGKRSDNDFVGFETQRVELKSYFIIDITAAYKLFETFSLKARIENLLDEEYEEVLHYNTLGRSFYGGFTFEL